MTIGEEILQAIEKPMQLTAEPPPAVDRMLGIYERQWTATAHQCELRAAELEVAAAELRKRAEDLYNARNFLDDVKQSVLFEIESRERAARLALVNPSGE